MKEEFNLKNKRKDLLERFKEAPLFDIMPLILEQDEEFIRRLKEELKKENSTNPDINAIITRGSILEIIDKLAGEKLK
jgi:hypothetical protein